MNQEKMRELLHAGIDQHCAPLTADPHRVQRVLNAANQGGTIAARRKLSAGVVLAFVLVLINVTAIAVAYLTASQIVETEVLPIAQKNDSASVNEWFSNEELSHIVRIAQENNIHIPEQLLTLLDNGQGYYEEEVIMSLLREEFGDRYADWSIEQKHWFGEVMVAIGFRDVNLSCLPGQDDIPCEDAVRISQEYIAENYRDDVSDENTWKRMVSFDSIRADDGSVKPPVWFLEYTPVTPAYNQYQLTISKDGTVLDCKVHMVPNTQSGDDIVSHYLSVYGGFRGWTYDVWANLGDELRACTPDTQRSWLFFNAAYVFPPKDGLSYEEAQRKAVEAVGAEYATTRSAVCCSGSGETIWKIEVLIQKPEDIGSGKYTAIWLAEIDAMSGETKDVREFVVGSDTDPLLTFVPQSVWDSLPLMPETPNG